MQLLPPELKVTIPMFYAQEENPSPTVYVKFFLPGTDWTWYVTEGEAQGSDYMFFGYVFGLEPEWGYFLLSELERVRNRFMLTVERDLNFVPAPLKEVKERHQRERGE